MPQSHEWTLHDLDEAYRRGHENDLSERYRGGASYPHEDIRAISWGPGHHDGGEHHRPSQAGSAALLQARLRNDSARPPLAEDDFGLRMQRLALARVDTKALRQRTELTTPATRALADGGQVP